MQHHLLFLLLGLGAGATYALLGLGVVLEYRATNVVNFAHGALAMWVTFVYAVLRDRGDLLLPLVGPVRQVSLGAPKGQAVALCIAMVYAAVLGAVVYASVVRPMRHVPPLARLVASVGLMLLLQSLALVNLGATATQGMGVNPILPTNPVRLAGVSVPSDRFFVSGLACLAALALWAVFRFTRFGLATRAVSESELGAATLGISSKTVGAVNWIVATVLAGLAGILLAPIARLDITSYSLFVVPAIAVALLGRFQSFGVTVVAGLALGMAQSWMTKLQFDFDWLPDSGMQELLPFVAITAALLVAGRSLPLRGDIASGDLPSVVATRRPFVLSAAWGGIGLAAMAVLDGPWRLGLIQSLIWAIVCLSLVLLVGCGGQVSLAQMTFAGASAFAVSLAADSAGIGFPWSAGMAVVVAVPVGIVVGLTSLRARGVHLAVATLAAAVAIEALVFKNTSITGGSAGRSVPDPTLFGVDLGIRGVAPGDFPTWRFGAALVVTLVCCCLAVLWFRRSRQGRWLLATRSNERAAAAMGISPGGAKLLAFGLSSLVAGVGGVAMAYSTGFVSGGPFAAFASLLVLAIAYVGGISRVSGAMIAGLALAAGGIGATALGNVLGAKGYEGVLGGIGLLLVTLRQPAGIAGLCDRWLPRPARRDQLVDDAVGVPLSTAQLGALGELTVVGLSISYDGVPAVCDVDLRVGVGEIVGLIGPNGAGKTSVIDGICGYALDCRGVVRLDGIELQALTPQRRARAGLARTFQTLELFDDLDTRENLRIAAENSVHLCKGLAGSRRGAALDARVAATLRGHGLAPVTETLAGRLSHGERTLVAVARAVIAHPAVLVLDEPAAGLSLNERSALGSSLRSLASGGVGVLLVDHDMELVMDVCTRIYVLDAGVVIADGSPAEIRRDRTVLEAYLGVDHLPTDDHQDLQTSAAVPT